MSDKDSKKATVAETVVGLPEVPADSSSTQLGLDEVITSPGQVLVTAPNLPPIQSTAPDLQPVPEPPTNIGPPPPAPARRASRLNVPAQAAEEPPTAPRRQSKLAVPQALSEDDAPPAPPRRLTREEARAVVADATTDERQVHQPSAPVIDTQPTNPRTPRPAALSDAPRFEWTLPRVAGLTGALATLGVIAWIASTSTSTTPRHGPGVDLTNPTPLRAPAPPPEKDVHAAPPVAATPEPTPAEPAAPARPTLALDARTHVVDPYGVHAPDLPLDTAHKYRLRIERDDSRLGTVLARLDERGGWGVLRKMASHAALQFGGAKALRLHCEPGRAYSDADTFPLELVDLATKKKIEFQVFPARHCWDLEVMRPLELGEGVRHRVRVPTDAKLKLGERVTLRVAWVLESGDAPKIWRAGVLAPGESLLAEGRRGYFAIFDSYAGDNDGRLELELLPPDTESSGLVSPSTESGAKFVPVAPPSPADRPTGTAPAVQP